MGNDQPLVFVKSSYSNGQGDCVEVATTEGARYVRDSKDKAGAVLGFPAASWGAFVEDLKNHA